MVAGGLSSIDVEDLPSHESRAIQVQHGVYNIRYVSHAPHWVECRQCLMGFGRAHWSLDDSRRHGVHTDNPKLIAKALREGLASVRGDLKYNVNGFLIQPYWKIEITAGLDGKAIERGGEKVMERGDSFAEKCPKDKQM